MRINGKVLNNFLERVTLKKYIPTMVLNFANDGLNVKLNAINFCITVGILKREAFTQYEELGEIGIRSTKKLIDMLKRYEGKDVVIKVENDSLKLVTESGSTGFKVCDVEMVDDNLTKEPNTSFDGGFEIDSNRFVEMKNAAKNVLDVNKLTVESKNNKLILKAESDVGDKIKEELDVEYNDASANYGEYLFKIIESIKGKVNVAFSSDYPMQIKEKGENFMVKYVVAPMVDSEEEKKKVEADLIKDELDAKAEIVEE